MTRDEAPFDAHPPFVINPRRKLFEAASTATNARLLLVAALGLTFWYVVGNAVDNLFGAREHLAPELVYGNGPQAVLRAAFARAAEPAVRLVGPFLDLFSYETTLKGRLHALVHALVGVVIWGIFGGALARGAVVRAARGEWLGIRPALLFAIKKGRPLIGAPLAPLIAVGFFAAISAGCGVIFRLGWIGRGVGGAVLVVPLACNILNAVILLGLAFAWPLMHVTIAAENEDGFDAVSRSFAYVTQRKALFAALALAAWVVGACGAVAADLLARLVVHLAEWSLALGGSDAVRAVLTDSNNIGATFWLGLVELLVRAWSWAFFWSAAAAIYLILRFDVDGTPWFDIAVAPPETLVATPDETPDAPAEPVEPVAEPAAAPAVEQPVDHDLTELTLLKPVVPLPDTDEFENLAS